MKHIVIIGNGVAGVTTARFIRKHSDHHITMISAESKHFFSRTALMYIYMGHMTYENTKPYEDWFWAKNRIDLIQDWVTAIDTGRKQVCLKKGKAVTYDQLVIAVGSRPNKFGWPGQDLKGVQGLYSLQDLANLEANTPGTRQAVVIGGGLIGIELAEMLRTRDVDVTFLVREDRYWGNVLRKEEAALIGRHIGEHHCTLKLETELAEILADEQGRARAVVTKHGEELPCQLVGLTAGVSPNIELVKESGIETGRGVLVNEYLETNVPDVYAAGDCAEIVVADGRNRVEQLWYTGRMQGEALGKTLAGQRTAYDRGVWFNSAKFFDIEYHTYGIVWPEPQDGEATFYWEDPNGKRAFRLVYDQQERHLIGMNSFGIRYRHNQFETWIAQKTPVDQVVKQLPKANFDPEFFRRFEDHIAAAFRAAHV